MKKYVIFVSTLPGCAREVFDGVSKLVDQEMGIECAYLLEGRGDNSVMVETKSLGTTALDALTQSIFLLKPAKIVTRERVAEDRSEWNDELHAC